MRRADAPVNYADDNPAVLLIEVGRAALENVLDIERDIALLLPGQHDGGSGPDQHGSSIPARRPVDRASDVPEIYRSVSTATVK